MIFNIAHNIITQIPYYNYIVNFTNKTFACNYYGYATSLFVYYYFFSHKKQFLVYLNTYECFFSYCLGFSYCLFLH